MFGLTLDSEILSKTKFSLVVLLGMAFAFDLPAIYVLPLLSLFLTVVLSQQPVSIKTLRISNNGYLLTILFVIHLLWFVWGIIETKSFSYLEKTLPLLLFPLMISSTRLDKEKLRTILTTFIYTLIVSYVLTLAVAIYNYFYSIPRWGRASDFFFHEQFTNGLFGIHPTYYGLLGCLATLFAFKFLKQWYCYLVVLILTIFIVLINARITLLIQFLLIISFLVKYLIQDFSIKKVVLTTMVFILLIGFVQVTNSIYDYPHRKMFLDIKASWDRSYASDISEGDGGLVTRFAIWRGAIEIIKSNALFGVGLGNEKEFLSREFKRKNSTYLAEFPNNAHNQVLSYLISVGLIGFILLTFFFLILLKDAYSKKCWFYIEFLLIFFIVSLTESVFTRDLGVSIFAYFNTLLILKYVNNDH